MRSPNGQHIENLGSLAAVADDQGVRACRTNGVANRSRQGDQNLLPARSDLGRKRIVWLINYLDRGNFRTLVFGEPGAEVRSSGRGRPWARVEARRIVENGHYLQSVRISRI